MIQNKLIIDAGSFLSDHEQQAYVVTCLAGDAARNAVTFVSSHPGSSASALLEYLNTIYSDPNAEHRARTRLYSLRMSESQPFPHFLQRFEQELAESGMQEWPEQARMDALKNAISPPMRQALWYRGVPNTYAKLVTRLHDISTQAYSLNIPVGKREKIYNSSWGKSAAEITSAVSGNGIPAYDPMEIDGPEHGARVSAARRSSSPTNPNGHPSTRPEDRQYLGKRAKWASKEEMHARRTEGRCLRCGRQGCRIARCPLAAARKPAETHTRAARAAVEDSPSLTITAQSEIVDDYESENE